MLHRLFVSVFSLNLLFLAIYVGCQQASAHMHGWIEQSPKTVGEARFQIFLFDIYDASLLSPDGRYDGNPPYALKLYYLRDIARQTIIDSSLEEMRRQGATDLIKLTEWADWLGLHIPDMKEGDEAVLVALAGGGMMLFHNGIKLGQIDDLSFTEAFLGIWLSDNALKPKLSRMLRGLGSE